MAETEGMTAPITRGEFREELARFEQRFQRFEEKIDQKLDIWGGALLARMDAKFEQMRQELAHLVRSSAEAGRAELGVIDDQYKDLPGRVARLERAVFKPTPKRPARKRRSA